MLSPLTTPPPPLPTDTDFSIAVLTESPAIPVTWHTRVSCFLRVKSWGAINPVCLLILLKRSKPHSILDKTD